MSDKPYTDTDVEIATQALVRAWDYRDAHAETDARAVLDALAAADRISPGDGLAKLREVVGRCGQASLTIFSDTGRPVCALPSGHAGWHRADDGCEWGIAEPSQP